MQSPSSGVLLSIVIGPAGRIIIAVGVIVAILASWLTWTLMLSEMPYAAAKQSIFQNNLLELIRMTYLMFH